MKYKAESKANNQSVCVEPSSSYSSGASMLSDEEAKLSVSLSCLDLNLFTCSSTDLLI